ncbi:PAS domain S-box protein [bacterium]|nr:PAS domain S-box protein [bacterium]
MPRLNNSESKKFLSLSSFCPEGFHEFSEDGLQSPCEELALFVDTVDEGLEIFKYNAHVKCGLIIMRGDVFSQVPGSPGFYQLTITEDMLPGLYNTAFCILDIIAAEHKYHQESSIEKHVEYNSPELNKELEQLKQDLQASEARLRLITENTRDLVGITTFDMKVKIIYASPSYEKILGYSPEELIGRSAIDLIHPEDKKRLLPLLHKYISAKIQQLVTGENEEIFEKIEYRLPVKSGGWCHVEAFATPIGKKIVFTQRNITERKKIEAELKESELRYRTFFENSYNAILIIKNERFVKCNAAAVAMLGYDDKDELFNVHPSKLSPEYQADGRQSLEKSREMMRIARERGCHRFIWNHVRRNGEVFPVDVALTAIIEKGEVLLHTIWRDISEQVHIEQALRASEEQLRSISNNLPNAVIYQVVSSPDEHRKFRYISENIKELNNISADQVINNPLLLYKQVREDYQEKLHIVEELANKELKPFVFEAPFIIPGGLEKWFIISATPQKVDDGKILWNGVITDITKRKKLETREKDLAKISREIIYKTDLERMLRNVLKVMLDIFECDRAWLLYPADPEAAEYEVAVTRTRAEWKISEGLTLPVDVEAAEILRIALDNKNPTAFFATRNPKISRQLLEEFSVKSQLVMPLIPKINKAWLLGIHYCAQEKIWTDDEIRLFHEIGSRITESLNILLFSKELEKSKNYIANIIDSMPSVLIGVDIAGCVTQWNIEAEHATGVSFKDAVGERLNEVMPYLSREMNKIEKAIIEQHKQVDLKQARHVNGMLRYENITIYPLTANGVEGAVIRIDDVTDKVHLEEMMIQSEKMLSVGGLAAGMAHEINNPLAGIMQTASVMANRLGKQISSSVNRKKAEDAGTTIEAIIKYMEACDIPSMLETINKSGRRVADIVDNMLSFARKSNAGKSSYIISELIEKTIVLAVTDYDMKRNYDFKMIKIIREYEGNLPLVPCEGGKIQQVLLNILRNGAQAMQEKKERHEDAGTWEPCFIIRLAHEMEEHMLRIEIEDNGSGMDKETCKRAFEPFFTTKAVGVGTGLGLSVSYFIITENHNGMLSVESTPGKGAKFIIRLPIGNN